MKLNKALFLIHSPWKNVFLDFMKNLQNYDYEVIIHFYELITEEENDFLTTNNFKHFNYPNINFITNKLMHSLHSKYSISDYIKSKLLRLEHEYYYTLAMNYLFNEKIIVVYTHTDLDYRHELAIIKAAKDLNIPVIVPAGIIMEPDLYWIRKKENLKISNNLNSFQKNIYNKISSEKYGKQIIEGYFRYPAYIIDFLLTVDSLSTAPFVFGGSPNIKTLCVANKYSYDISKKNGVPEEKIKILGDVNYDILFRSFNTKNKIKETLKIKTDKKIAIFAVPPLFEHKYVSFETSNNDIEFIIKTLTKNNFFLILSFHPMMNISDYKYLSLKYNCIISSKSLNTILPIADIYVTTLSNTICWSLICGIRTIVYDFYNLESKIGQVFESAIFVDSKNYFEEAICMGKEKMQIQEKDKYLLSEAEVFDGKALNRYLAMNNKLSKNKIKDNSLNIKLRLYFYENLNKIYMSYLALYYKKILNSILSQEKNIYISPFNDLTQRLSYILKQKFSVNINGFIDKVKHNDEIVKIKNDENNLILILSPNYGQEIYNNLKNIYKSSEIKELNITFIYFIEHYKVKSL